MTQIKGKVLKTIFLAALPLALLAALVFSQSNSTQATGEIGLWHFDETSGTTASDSSGNNNTGTLINGPVWAAGKSGNALQFNGTNSYVDAGNQAVLKNISSAITVEMWFNFAVNQYEGLLGYPGKTWLMLRPNNGDSYVYLTGAAGHNWIAAPYNLNQWYHYAVTYDSAGGADNTKIYLNGQVIKTFTDTGSLAQATGNLKIGDTGSYKMNGLIDEVKIYNRALTGDEVLADYSGGSPTPAPSVTTTPTPTITSTPTPTPIITPTPTPTTGLFSIKEV